MKTVPLRAAVRLVNGGTPTSEPEHWDGDVHWATPIDLAPVDGGTLHGTARRLTRAGLRNGSATVPEDSLLVSIRAPIGYVSRTTASTAFNQGCRGLVPRAGWDCRFLQFVLMDQRANLLAAGTGATFQELSSEALAATRVPLIGREEQRRIADFLDDQVARLDAASATSRAALERSEEGAAAAVHAAVTGQGFAQRQESPLLWAPTLPSHWSAVKLGLVARMGTGHTPSRSDESLWINCTIPWLTTNDVHRFRRDEIDVLDEPALSISKQGLDQSAAVLHPAGTVALSRTASAGYSVLMGRDMATSQDFVTWSCGPGLRPNYLLAVLRASRSDLLGRLAMGSTHKTIYFPDLEAIRVPLPPLEDQDTAIESVRIAFDRIRRLRCEVGDLLSLLEERKRALITACINGEFDVTSAARR